jgi:hypothetical protein
MDLENISRRSFLKKTTVLTVGVASMTLFSGLVNATAVYRPERPTCTFTNQTECKEQSFFDLNGILQTVWLCTVDCVTIGGLGEPCKKNIGVVCDSNSKPEYPKTVDEYDCRSK